MPQLPSPDRRMIQGTYVELVQSVLATLVPTTIMSLLFVIVSVFCLVRTPDLPLALLAVAGTVASAVRVRVILLCRPSAADMPAQVERARQFERRFGKSYVAFAILLGLFATRAMLISGAELHMVVATLVVGYAAGVAAGVSLRPRISLLAINCSVLPLAGACVVVGDIAHLILALMLAALLVGGTASMLRRYRWTSEIITMRHLLASVARKDPLTGLSNRLDLAEAFRWLRGSDSGTLALHCLDLDRFKPVNDQLGHLVGDRLLQNVAARLERLAGDSHVAARLGGDEFALLQTGIAHPEEVELVRRRIGKALSEPYAIDGHTISIGVSVGSATTADRSTDLKTLMAEADAASYREKSAGHVSLEALEERTLRLA